MSFFQFLFDRFAYVIVYFITIILVLLVVKLGLFESGVSISTSNLFYIGLLSIVLLLIYLFIDYLRQRPFYVGLNNASKEADLQSFLKMTAVTREQQVFKQLCEEAYQDYAEKLYVYEEQQKQNYYFTNRWTHQMKTPLSVIRLMLEEEEEWTKEELLEQIDEETLKLQDGLQMMLSTIRMQKFELDFSVEKIELLSFIRSILHDKRKTFIRYRIFPKLETDYEEMMIESDKKWLTFVLEQLLHNALKYSHGNKSEDSKYIKIAIELTENKIKLTITDKGIGIKREDLPRVFDPFFTGENGRRLQESTGMGLYLAKRICDQLHHPIMLHSVENEGTVVELHFQQSFDYYEFARDER
ncbi:sensor histidine kinase [Cytobacillus dafuensis]|uniref:histidine kinase n=1 Tax=Cytobacillus dafuensis TaxID=1742359 RepID=A0A5B8Z1B3_CYTDA|nr:sensor histidine kinase [Cytobacillus dafuensis]QED46668.1 HAMP domain-containing histidine kinase [Cytobacillus dafuensis]